MSDDRDRERPPFLIPHQRTFAAFVGALNHAYRYRRDEALRMGRDRHAAMRRDPFIMGLLNERYTATAGLGWHLESDDATDPQQQQVLAELTDAIELIPRFGQMVKYLLEAIWFGRHGSQLTWGYPDGSDWLTVVDHQPVNGDKFQYLEDSTPAVWFNRTWTPPDGCRVITTDRNAALVLDRPELRERFVIHRHEPEDADYFEWEQGGLIHGAGVRHRLALAHSLRDEMLGWAADAFQKQGTLGIVLVEYDENGVGDKERAEQVARDLSGKNAIAIPRRDRSGGSKPVEILQSATAGLAAMTEFIQTWFEPHMERLVIGQALSSKSEGGGMGGTGVANLHALTKFNIVKADAEGLGETLTTDLVRPMARYRYGSLPFRVRFVFDVPDPQAEKKLKAAESLHTMGIPFKAEEARTAAGFSKPDEGDEIVAPAPPPAPPGVPGQPGASPPGGPPAPGQPPQPQSAEPKPVPTAYGLEPHKFSTTQFNLPDELADAVRRLGRSIPDADLAGDGREAEPHITLLYGLHTDAPSSVRRSLAGEEAIVVTLGNVSLFRRPEKGFDVVKIDVEGKGLHSLRQALAATLPNTQTHPDYKPHVTLAYVKPGAGDKYVGPCPLTGMTVILDCVTFNSRDGESTAVPLASVADDVTQYLADDTGWRTLGRLVPYGEFREEDHPRAADGKFGSGSGDGTSEGVHEAFKAAGVEPSHEFLTHALPPMAAAFDKQAAGIKLDKAALRELVDDHAGDAEAAWKDISEIGHPDSSLDFDHVFANHDRARDRAYSAAERVVAKRDRDGDGPISKDWEDAVSTYCDHRLKQVIAAKGPEIKALLAGFAKKHWGATQYAAEFREADHPRAADGKFGSGGGSATGDDSAPAPKPSPAAPPRRTVRLAGEAARANIERVAPGATLGDLANWAGAKDGATVTVTSDGERIRLVVEHPDYKAERVIRPQGDTLAVVNYSLKVRTPGGGLGAALFAEQVRSLAASGRFGQIRCTAGGDPTSPGMNGFYTWPRLGYDGAMSADARRRYAKDHGTDAPGTVQDLFARPGGAAWWKSHGEEFEATFDLAAESRSQQVLAAYLAEKKAKPQ